LWPVLVVAATFFLEPLARAELGTQIGSSTVLWAEVAVGVVVAIYVAAAREAARGQPSS
jgi:hypothetical protein